MFSLLLKTVDTLLLSKVWCVPIGGMCVRQPMTIGGSGSSYLYGMMDHTYRVSNINITELTVTFAGEHASEGMRGLGPAGCHTGFVVICVTSYRLLCFNLLLTGNQERWQLRRMLQNGNYHQGEI